MRKILMILIFTSVLHSYGGHPGAFLRIGFGAEPLALGGAFTALAYDAYAIYWNPAGITTTRTFAVSTSLRKLPLDRQQSFIGVTKRLSDSNVIGFSWVNSSITKIDGRDDSGNPTGSLSTSENAFTFSFGHGFNFANIGMNLKFISNSLANVKGNGFSIDIGTQIFVAQTSNLGITFQDIGGKINWTTGLKEKIPSTIRMGFGTEISDMFFEIDISKAEKENPEISLGTEYHFMNDMLMLRVGYVKITSEPYNSFSMGIGFRPKSSLIIDYSITEDPLAGKLTHVLGVTVSPRS